MESQAHGFAVRIAGFLLGTLGYGLSVFTYVLGAFLQLVLPESISHPVPNIPRLKVQPPGKHLSRRVRNPMRTPSPQATAPARLMNIGHEEQSFKPSPETQLRRISSLDSFHRTSFPVDTPMITINHPDYDYSSSAVPTVTLHSAVVITQESKVAETPEIPPIGPFPATETSLPPADPFANLRVQLVNEKHRLYRSASSPQLTEFEPLPLPPRTKKECPKAPFTLIGKSSRSKILRQEKSDTVLRQITTSKFFSPSQKNLEKKKSQVLRTQPYSAPYFVPQPLPTTTARAKEGKRSKTLPPPK